MSILKPILDSLQGEIKFTSARSGGPGGQSVNKVNTKITLRWNIKDSKNLNDDQKAIILKKLSNRINQIGEVVIAIDKNRSQMQNKEEALAQLANLISMAFKKVKPRKPTKPTRASVRKRLENKKKLSDKKNLRGKVD